MKLRKTETATGVKWFTRWRTKDGKQLQKTWRNLTAREAERAFAKFQAEVLSEQSRGEDESTLAEVLAYYVDNRREQCGRKYIEQIDKFRQEMLEFFGGGSPAEDLGMAGVNRYIRHLSGLSLKVRSINARLRFLHSAYGEAERFNRIRNNQIKSLSMMADREPRKYRRIPDEDLERILRAAREGVTVEKMRKNGRKMTMRIPPPVGLYDLLIILINTGARLGEALALQWDDIDWTSGLIRFNTRKKARPGQSAKERKVHMSPPLAKHLRAIQGKQIKPVSRKNKSDESESENNWQRKWGKTLEHLGIPKKYRIHDLRHTFASNSADAGVQPFTLKEILGHSSIETTMRYFHVNDDVLKGAIDKVGKYE